MIDCIILGDSIAVGIGQARPECVAYVKQGIDSYTWNNRNIYKNLSAGTVIISLGSNDGPQVNTFQEILALRQFVSAARVFWILPANKPAVQDMIKIVAKNYKDTVLTIPELSKDRLHPTRQAYQELAKQTRIEKE